MSKRYGRAILVALALGVVLLLEPMLAILVGLTVVNLLVREFFPFSHFPMYTGFGASTFYLYLANEDDEPVPVRHFRLSASSLKKIYRTQVWDDHPGAKIEQLPAEAVRRAGQHALAYLRQHPAQNGPPATYTTLRLYQVNLSMEHDGIRKETVLVTEG